MAKNWIKPRAGSIPPNVIDGYENSQSGDVIFVWKPSREKEIYAVEIGKSWSNSYTIISSFTSKDSARTYMKKWMRDHPVGE